MPKVRQSLVTLTRYVSRDNGWPRDNSNPVNTYDGTTNVSENNYVYTHIDLGDVRRDVSIYGTTSNDTAEIYLATTHDPSAKWYVLPHKSTLLGVTHGGSTLYHFHMNCANVQARYIKVFIGSEATNLDLRYTSTRY